MGERQWTVWTRQTRTDFGVLLLERAWRDTRCDVLSGLSFVFVSRFFPGTGARGIGSPYWKVHRPRFVFEGGIPLWLFHEILLFFLWWRGQP